MEKIRLVCGLLGFVFLGACASRPAPETSTEQSRNVANNGPDTMVFRGWSPALPQDYRNTQCSFPDGDWKKTFDFIYWNLQPGQKVSGLIKPQATNFDRQPTFPLTCKIEGRKVDCSIEGSGEIDLEYVRGPIKNDGTGPQIRGEISISKRLIAAVKFPLPEKASCDHNGTRP